MADYTELIQALREEAEWAEGNEWETPIMLSDHLKQAADAIEKLQRELLTLKMQMCCCPKEGTE